MSEPGQPQSLSSIVGSLSAWIDSDGISPGDLASLRRLDPKVPPMAFWKLVVDSDGISEHLYRTAGDEDNRERRWAAVCQALAILRGLRSDQVYLGRALAETGFSELRLERLLRGDEVSIFDSVRLVARFLEAKGQAVEPGQLARLLLEQEPTRAEQLRRHIAQDYFRALHHTASKES